MEKLKSVQSSLDSETVNVTVTGLVIQFNLDSSFKNGSRRLLNEVKSVLDSINDKMRICSDELRGVQILNADTISHNNLIILDDKSETDDEDTDDVEEDWDENGDDSEWDDEDEEWEEDEEDDEDEDEDEDEDGEYEDEDEG